MRKTADFLALFCVCLFVFANQIYAKDVWVNVRSKNFNLIGNAGEKDIRGVATKLEQFREVFRQVFPKTNLNSAIPTNVIVFKNSAAYRPFKPKGSDGLPDENISGYFQPNEDVNYITISTEGSDNETYGTIFHEYVHYLIDTNFGRTKVPLWFNEGLAEYYQTFKIKDDQKVTLGGLQQSHLYILQNNQMPLKTLFETDGYALRQGGSYSRSVFYAQSWALVHYLIHGKEGARDPAFNDFLNLLLKNVEPEKAFKQTFQRDYAAMEKELKEYVEQKKFVVKVLNFNSKLTFDTEITVKTISEAEAGVYLGDLLYRLRYYGDAEKYLQNALALDPESAFANMSYGMVKTHQRKFGEAKIYLEKALAKDENNYFVNYNYGYFMVRENVAESGATSKYSREQFSAINRALSKAIQLKPGFAESYRLLAFVNLVNEVNLDEALILLKKALTYQPGNQNYALLQAQILLKQERFSEVREIAEKLSKTANNDYLRSNANGILLYLDKIEGVKNYQELIDEIKSLTGEVKKDAQNADAKNRLSQAVKKLLHKPDGSEQQKLVVPEKTECVGHYTYFVVRSGERTLRFRTTSPQSVKIASLNPNAVLPEINCSTKLPEFPAVISFSPFENSQDKSDGKITALEFVPEGFSPD